MNDLIDRYVYQVGLYVRPQERAEIEAELRSQIHDQIEDGYGSVPTQADIAAVLRQLGDPRTMAASYSGEQYLIGPELYPFLMTVLRFGLPLVPTVVVIANVVGAVLSADGGNWLELLIGSIFTAAQAALIFLAVVVIIFAIVQHSGEELRAAAKAEFDPLKLPPANDPGSVDRVESGVGIAIGTLFAIAAVYFLSVGGLTLRFNLSDPGQVLPVPTGWLVVLLLTTIGSVLINLWALIRRRWTLLTWLAETTLNIVGAVGFYFVILMPVLERVKQAVPELSDAPLDEIVWIITLLTVIVIVLASGSKLIRLWQQRQAANA